ncbi:MAG: xanthine dehydrogenase family protein subunit M [Polyangiales bacterium]
MKDFDYVSVNTTQEAIAALRAPGRAAIAGGTELLNWLRLGIAAPDGLVDVGRLRGHAGIAIDDDMLVIGAATTLAAIGDNAAVQSHAAVLSEACLRAASPQIRNRATIGGNVLQKTRCVYFRAEAPLPWGCNKREPGTGCAALHGLNERHAILGWTDACVATHPSDPAVALACLDAQAEVAGPAGVRFITMTDFHVTQQEADDAQRETQLAPDELIVRYRLPLHAGESSAYVKVRERESYEYALVSAAATLQQEAGRVVSARMALGSVAQKPWRLGAAEAAVVGMPVTREGLLSSLQAALSEARPLEHNAYKVTMAANAALRALLRAGGAA